MTFKPPRTRIQRWSMRSRRRRSDGGIKRRPTMDELLHTCINLDKSRNIISCLLSTTPSTSSSSSSCPVGILLTHSLWRCVSLVPVGSPVLSLIFFHDTTRHLLPPLLCSFPLLSGICPENAVRFPMISRKHPPCHPGG